MNWDATSSRAVLQALGGELPAEWPTQQVVLANAHGLHARRRDSGSDGQKI